MGRSINRAKVPFILQFAVKQKNTARPLQTYYDEEQQLTMVKVKNAVLPLVKFKNPVVELLTKTEATREQDDYNSTMLDLELFTKTAAARESDEASISYLELMTKTFVKRETDDVSPGIN